MMYTRAVKTSFLGYLAVLFVGALFVPQPASGQALKKGEEFPAFAEPDLLTGKLIDLKSFRGKVVLVDFWAVWCGPCVAEIPNIKKAYDKYHQHGFEVISISLDQDLAKCKAFIKEKGMNWHHIADGKGWKAKLAVKHKISGIPVSVLVDKDGKIIALDLRGEKFSKAVAEALGVKYEPPPGEEEASAKLAAADKLRDEGKSDEALKVYDEIAEKYAETSAARVARMRAAELRELGPRG